MTPALIAISILVGGTLALGTLALVTALVGESTVVRMGVDG